MFKRGFSICLVRNYSPTRSVGPTDPPEYNWLYSIPAAVFTGGFLLAAQTGFAGLVQAGYLASSILCIGRCRICRIGSLYPQTVSTRFSHRTGLPVYRKTRQCPRYARRWLWFPHVLGRRWIPTSRPRAIRYVDCCRRGHWLDHWKEDYRHGASSDGGRLVFFFRGVCISGELTLLLVFTALHSVVGLAAVLTSIGSVLADVGHASMLHVRISPTLFSSAAHRFRCILARHCLPWCPCWWNNLHWVHRCLL